MRKDENYARVYALQFFSKDRCVVTGTSVSVEWHHLDENHSHWSPFNLIPISADLNAVIEKMRRQKKSNKFVDDPRELSVENLISQAREHWNEGSFASCYACNRLAAYLSSSYRQNADRALRFGQQALHALRPLRNIDFAVDTLKRDILPLLANTRPQVSVSFGALAELCHELSAFYLDRGDIKEFRRWSGLSTRLLSRTSSELQELENPPLRLRIQQHAVLCRLIENSFQGNESLEDLFEQFKKFNYPQGLGTVLEHLARRKVISGELETAESLVNALENKVGPVECLQNGGAPAPINGGRLGWRCFPRLLLLRGEILFMQDRATASDAFVDGALEIIRQKHMTALGAMRFFALKSFLTRYPSCRNDLGSPNQTNAAMRFRRLANEAFTHCEAVGSR